MTHAPTIVTRGLGRVFGRNWAVRGLDLSIDAGELYGFLGPNGAGKSTTLRMLAGLLRPSAGSLQIAGLDHLTASRALKQLMGFVPDTPPLHDYLTGRQYIALVASLWRIDRRTRDQRAGSLLELLLLDDVADDLCKSYSHGTRKKIHLAAVMTTAPLVLLLDEPTTGLDPRSARALKDLLVAETARGTTVLLSTHVLETAEQICHRVGILHQGSLRAEGTPAELRTRHGADSLEATFLRLTAPEPHDDGPPAG